MILFPSHQIKLSTKDQRLIYPSQVCDFLHIIGYKYFILFLCILLSTAYIGAQQSFQSPVDHSIRLSGTFGELRSNHFHTGLDIKSAHGRTGDPIKAVWDGHISRIKINIAGYGHALYIDHPNGLTSVYAHLHEFNPALDSFLLSLQYSLQTYELDTLLADTLFPINQGELIGKMGTSGYSFGPHLHFELRNTKTERPINPLGRYVQVADNTPPVIRSIYIYSLDEHKNIVGKKRHNLINSRFKNRKSINTFTVYSKYAAIGVESFDRSDKSRNKNGVYQININSQNSPLFECSFDSLSFDYKSLINTHIDYEEKRKNNKNVHRCLLYDVGHPHLGDNILDKGVITLTDTTATPISVQVQDRSGNQTKLELAIIGSFDTERTHSRSLSNTDIPFHSSVSIDLGHLTAYLPKNSFETDYSFHSDTSHEDSHHYISPVYHIGQDRVALLKPMSLYYDLSHMTDSIQNKCFIGSCGKDGFINHGSLREGPFLYTEVKAMGDYMIMIDTIPPLIQPKKWSDDWSNLPYISFIIKDNMDAKSMARDLISHATIDDQWVLMKYDYKNNLIRYDMDVPLDSGVHHFRLSVADDLGNTSHFNKTIYTP